MLKKTLIRGIIPFLIMSLISLIMKMQNMDPFQVKSTFIVGIIASVVSATFSIYEIESWSLLKQSIAHFFVMLFTVFPCLLLSGWFNLEVPLDYLKVFGIFILFGIVGWNLGYFIFGKLLQK